MDRLFRAARHPPLRLVAMAVAVGVTVATAACASRPPDAKAASAIGSSPRDASVDRAKAAMHARDWTGARDALERAADDAKTPDDMANVTYWRATLAAYQGDLVGAARLLETDLAIWEPARDDPHAHAYWRLNALTWIDWADHRLTDALARIERSKAWIATSALPDEKKQAMLRHYAWDRAYILVDLAAASPRPTRDAIDGALAARDAYARMAAGVDSPSSLDVLDLHVMDLTHDTAAAAVLHARMAGADLDDVQDLYVLRCAQLRDARFADAAITEQKIVRFPQPYLMHAIVLGAMAGSAAPRP